MSYFWQKQYKQGKEENKQANIRVSIQPFLHVYFHD